MGCEGCGGVKKAQTQKSNDTIKDLQKKTSIENNEKVKSISDPYLPIGGSYDSILFYYLDSPMVKKYELYGESKNNFSGIYPHSTYISDPEDKFGRENIGIIIREPKSNKTLKKINWIYEDNPFRKEGFEELKRIRHYIYFKTPDGAKTPKSKFKKYLPPYLYDEIPQYLTEGEFLTQNRCGPTLNGFTICQHTFEVEGVEREWIHGDYATSRNYIYDHKGILVLEYFGDCEDVTVDVDPSGQYAIIIKNYNVYKKYDGVPQKSCLEIIDLSTKKVAYEECEIDFAWQIIWSKFGHVFISSDKDESRIRNKLNILNPNENLIISINGCDRNKVEKAIISREKWIEITTSKDTIIYDLINPSQFTKLK
jgi:hypothetical protein